MKKNTSGHIIKRTGSYWRKGPGKKQRAYEIEHYKKWGWKKRKQLR